MTAQDNKVYLTEGTDSGSWKLHGPVERTKEFRETTAVPFRKGYFPLSTLSKKTMGYYPKLSST
jgi:hypothetical protein